VYTLLEVMMLARCNSLWVSAIVAVAVAHATAFAAGGPSPFDPAPSGPVQPQVGDRELEALQLSGISVIGSQQSFNLTDSISKKSFWVSLNETVNGFRVVSFDPQNDSVVVHRGAFSRVVPLRRAVIAVQAVPVPVPAASPPAEGPKRPVVGVNEIANPKTPKEVAQAEFEARMLVSDLMEISMQERARQRALREAQQKQQGQPQPPAPVVPVAAPGK
jgi:hypothetical protein